MEREKTGIRFACQKKDREENAGKKKEKKKMECVRDEKIIEKYSLNPSIHSHFKICVFQQVGLK